MRAFPLRLWFVGIWTLVSLTACTSDDSAEPEVRFPATSSVVSIDTVTFSTSTAFLQGATRTAARITGELSLPASNEERLPAVILMHGSSGVSNIDRQWAVDINSIGLATFYVDSLTGRGLAGVATMRSLPRLIDAYQALAVLAQHPRIDSSRIALMGRSQGGTVALYAGVERFQRLYKATGATFAAYVPFYPLCNFTFMQEDQRDGRPIRLFHGTADTLTPIQSCRELVTRLRQRGHDITLREFPGAHHAFDSMSTVFTLSTAPGLPVGYTQAGCFLVELPDSQLVNRETGQELTPDDPCIRFDGGNLGDPAARSQAATEVTAFFRSLFNLRL